MVTEDKDIAALIGIIARQNAEIAHLLQENAKLKILLSDAQECVEKNAGCRRFEKGAEAMILERFSQINEPAPPFSEDGKYGYRVNIRNPVAAELWRRYRKKLGLPSWCPASDEERLEFEVQVIPYLESRFHEKAPPVTLPRQVREKLPLDLLARLYGVPKELVWLPEEKIKK